MDNRTLKILLVEDDEDDYVLTRELLLEAKGRSFELDWVSTYEAALEAFAQKQHDVYLVDYRLDLFDGLELVREVVARGCHAPIILMTGQGSYDIDVEAMRVGVTDYLVKSEVTAALLERTIRYSIERKQSEEALRKAHDELEQRVHERTQELAVANVELRAEIAERRQAQEALSESETRFRTLAESTSTAIFILQGLQIRYANPAAQFITGYALDELISRQFWEVAHPDYQKIVRKYGLANQWIEQLPSRYELKLLTKDGRERWVDISSGSVELEGSPALVVTAFDITERDLAEKELKKAKEELEVRVAERTRELRNANKLLAEANVQLAKVNESLARANQQLANTNQQLQTVLQALPVGVWIADTNGQIIDKNEMADKIWGNTVPVEENNSGGAAYQTYWADNGQMVKDEELALARALTQGKPVIGDVVNIHQTDGTISTLLNSAAPIFDASGCISGAVAVSQDITQRIQAEEEMRRDAAQIEVQRHLIQYREMERLNIAQDLHDGPLQELIGIAYSMADIMQVAGERNPATDPLLTKLNSVQERLKGQIRDLRLFCSELRPPTLVPFGLEKAIRSHAEAFQNRYENLSVQLELMPDGHLLPEQIRLALFRIYQEMLNNVARHSQANEVTVRFQLDEHQAILEIIDNGRGFEVPAAWVEMARHGHLGLVGAQERAQAVGGSLSITSALQEGTRVQVWVPRDQQNGDQ